MYNYSPHLGMTTPFVPGIGGSQLNSRYMGTPNIMGTGLPVGLYPMGRSVNPAFHTSPGMMGAATPGMMGAHMTPGMFEGPMTPGMMLGGPTTPVKHLSPFPAASPGYAGHMSPGSFSAVSPRLAQPVMLPQNQVIHVQPPPPQYMQASPQVVGMVGTAPPQQVQVVQAPPNQVLAVQPQPTQVMIQQQPPQFIQQQPATMQLQQSPQILQQQQQPVQLVQQQAPAPQYQVVQSPPPPPQVQLVQQPSTQVQLVSQPRQAQVVQMPASQVVQQPPITRVIKVAPKQVVQQQTPVVRVVRKTSQSIQQPVMVQVCPPTRHASTQHLHSLSPPVTQLSSSNSTPALLAEQAQLQTHPETLRVSTPATQQRIQQNLQQSQNGQLQDRRVSTSGTQTTQVLANMDQITEQFSLTTVQGDTELGTQPSRKRKHDQDMSYQDGGYHTQDSEYPNHGIAQQWYPEMPGASSGAPLHQQS